MTRLDDRSHLDHTVTTCTSKAQARDNHLPGIRLIEIPPTLAIRIQSGPTRAILPCNTRLERPHRFQNMVCCII